MIKEQDIKYSNKQAFIDKVQKVADNLGINPNWLMAVMWKESKFNSAIQNPVSLATGLIQFMPNTAIGLGTSILELKFMDPIRQLDYVEKYFKPFKGKIRSYGDMYMATFLPIYLGAAPDTVMKVPGVAIEKLAAQNPAIDLNKDGKLTVGEFHDYCFIGFTPEEVNILKGITPTPENVAFAKKKGLGR